MQQAVMALSALPHGTEAFVFLPERAVSRSRRVPIGEAAFAKPQVSHPSCPFPRREGPKEITISEGVVSFRTLTHVTRPFGA
jgi:hypothetical protein